MKLNQRNQQQGESDEQAKRDRQILGEEKPAKAEHPRHNDHYLELARGVRFDNLERHQDDDEGHAGLNSLYRTISEKDSGEGQSCENQLTDRRSEPVTFRLHPK